MMIISDHFSFFFQLLESIELIRNSFSFFIFSLLSDTNKGVSRRLSQRRRLEILIEQKRRMMSKCRF